MSKFKFKDANTAKSQDVSIAVRADGTAENTVLPEVAADLEVLFGAAALRDKKEIVLHGTFDGEEFYATSIVCEGRTLDDDHFKKACVKLNLKAAADLV